LVIHHAWIGRNCALQVCRMPELVERWKSVPAAYLQRWMQHKDWEKRSDCTRPWVELVVAVDVKLVLPFAVAVAVVLDVVLVAVGAAQAGELVDVAQAERPVAAVVVQVAMLEVVAVVWAAKPAAVVVALADT
jgi:hypothetical protein